MKIQLDVNKELGQLMKAMRLSKGLRQEDMAKILGVTRPHIPNMEQGKICNILLSHLVNCGDACGFDVKLVVTKKSKRNKHHAHKR